MKNLTDLNLGDNFIPGEFPRVLFYCSKLQTLDLSDNYFVGLLPEDIDRLSQLRSLILGGNNFTGDIPASIGRLKELRELELRANLFDGSLPPEIGNLSNLETLKLDSNMVLQPSTLPSEYTQLKKLKTFYAYKSNLIGEIPERIGDMAALEDLDLQQNRLTGKIPEGLFTLKNLSRLLLSRNKLSGEMPQVVEALNLRLIDLSDNNLSGRVLKDFENSIYADSFLDNPGLSANSGDINLKLCNAKPQQPNKLSYQHLALIITLCIAVFLAALCFSYYVIRCYSRKRRLDSTWRLTSFQRLDFTETNIVSGLTKQNLIGSGGSGKVYRVPVNHQGGIVAVKRIWNNWKLEDKLEQEFAAEVKILSSIRHTNIVKLLCCISSKNSKLLVYEHLENRSLDRWLHSKNRQFTVPITSSVHDIILDWPRRLQIAVGAAQGLCYMHHDCVPPVIHCDIKSSNILLDSDFNAKIADFRLAKLLVKQGELATMSTVAGSFGYMAPEYAHTTRVNEKIDVYSFGVILLELATGREANNGEEHTSIAEWAWRHIQEGKPVVDILDEEIKEPSYLDEMYSVFLLGLRCTEKSPSRRLSMKEVVYYLLRCDNPITCKILLWRMCSYNTK